MNIFVLYNKSGLFSGRVLGESLRKALNGTCSIYQGKPPLLKKLQEQGKKFDYVINVGWFKEIDAPGAVILNDPRKIARSSNKKAARVFFQKKDIRAPKLWLDPTEIPASEFPVVGRTTHHSKGRGFYLCKNNAEAVEASRTRRVIRKKRILTKKGNRVWRDRPVVLEGASHFLKFIKNTREFRVHAMAPKSDLKGLVSEDYLVLKLSEKTSNEENASGVIKNHDNGWVFGYPEDAKEDIFSDIRQLGRETVAELGLHWGAVDIIMSKEDNSLYVLEVNSTPCLTDENSNTLEKYTQAFKILLGLSAPAVRSKSKTELERVKERREDRIRNLLQKVDI